MNAKLIGPTVAGRSRKVFVQRSHRGTMELADLRFQETQLTQMIAELTDQHAALARQISELTLQRSEVFKAIAQVNVRPQT